MTTPQNVPPLLERIERKLAESNFFLDKMVEMENVNSASVNADLDQFRYYTSAFLTAIRSPIQYLYEDVKLNAAAKSWYDSEISNRPVLRFLKSERDANIHTMSATPMATVRILVDEGSQTDTTSFYQEWLDYSETDKRVTNLARTAIESIRELVQNGITNGHIS